MCDRSEMICAYRMFWKAASAEPARISVSTQLIDTRSDMHVWAEQYDRDLDDLFSIQSEIAQKVAERLNAKVTSAERLAIEEKPTTDLVAFELYSRANDIIGAGLSWGADTLRA